MLATHGAQPSFVRSLSVEPSPARAYKKRFLFSSIRRKMSTTMGFIGSLDTTGEFYNYSLIVRKRV